MRPRHRLPTQWLLTDERQGERLWKVLERLPRGAGVVFRHYQTSDRAALAGRVRRICHQRGLLFVVAGTPRLARAWRADGSHGRHRGALTAPAHGVAELVAARRAGARLAFLSPLYATRSHPGGAALGRLRFGLAARGHGIAVAALGGVSPARGARLKPIGAVGFGAIDGWEDWPRPELAIGTGPSRLGTLGGTVRRHASGLRAGPGGGIPAPTSRLRQPK